MSEEQVWVYGMLLCDLLKEAVNRSRTMSHCAAEIALWCGLAAIYAEGAFHDFAHELAPQLDQYISDDDEATTH